MGLAFHFAGIHVHEMDLINPFSKKSAYEEESATGSILAPIDTGIRLEVLLICLESTKQFCERFLAISADEYQNICFVQWSAFIFATVVLYKLSIGISHLPEWNTEVARSTFNIEVFLDVLSSRIGRCHATLEQADLFSLMGPILANVKRTYDRLKHLPQSCSASDTSSVHVTDFSKTSAGEPLVSQMFQHRCPAFPFWRNQGSEMNSFGDLQCFSGYINTVSSASGDVSEGINVAEEHRPWAETATEEVSVPRAWGYTE